MSQPEEFIRIREVLRRSGYSRATLYRRISDGLFPKGRKDGRCTWWPRSEVDAWQERRLRQTGGTSAAGNSTYC